MNPILQDLVSLLDLETLEENLFRGQSRDLGGKSVFGGQVIGQALVAASRTLTSVGPVPHSLHAYFLRPGDMAQPIIYEVDRVRDGRSFTTRRVLAIQHGAPILSLMASFQQPEPGLEHQFEMPRVPMPEQLEDMHALRQRWSGEVTLPENFRKAFLRELAIEFRPVHPWNPLKPEAREPIQQLWFRAAGGRLPDKDGQPDWALHRCVLAYASDFNLLGTAMFPHGKTWFTPDMICASIDHALWFHRDARVDEWLLYSMDAPSSQGARGFSRGQVFTRDGKLVASMTQESLMRWTGIKKT